MSDNVFTASPSKLKLCHIGTSRLGDQLLALFIKEQGHHQLQKRFFSSLKSSHGLVFLGYLGEEEAQRINSYWHEIDFAQKELFWVISREEQTIFEQVHESELERIANLTPGLKKIVIEAQPLQTYSDYLLKIAQAVNLKRLLPNPRQPLK